MHDTIPVSEIMVTDVVTAPVDASASDAATLMRDRSVSSVVVLEDESPVGIVTEGDFATQLCQRSDLGHLELEGVMSTPLETIESGASLVEAVSVLRADSVEHLPVVDDGRLVGILTTTELSYFVPHLVHRQPPRAELPPKRTVRTDTEYERDNWSFKYHGEDESTVSVGDVARFSKPISREDVEAFAEVTGDTNRVHLDGAYAAETRFGKPIVHGVLANGIISCRTRPPAGADDLSLTGEFLFGPAVDRSSSDCRVSRHRIARWLEVSDRYDGYRRRGDGRSRGGCGRAGRRPSAGR